jgi:hypothetical protein
MVQLHYSPGTASMIPHLLLEEMDGLMPSVLKGDL